MGLSEFMPSCVILGFSAFFFLSSYDETPCPKQAIPKSVQYPYIPGSRQFSRHAQEFSRETIDLSKGATLALKKDDLEIATFP